MPELFEIVRMIASDLWFALVEQAQALTTAQGLRANLRDYVLVFPAAMCLIWLGFAFLYVFRREWRLPWSTAFQPRVAVVVPARNEELVIAQTIEALLASNYPALELHVVSDGSDDRTCDIVRRFAARGVRLHDLPASVGKSRALQHVLDRCASELFMVIDADTVVEPSAVGLLVQQFASSNVAGVTGNPRVDNPGNLMTALQAMEYASIIGLIKRADSFWGGLFTVSGAAACFRTSALKAVGGWSARSVTEDIEISWRLQKAGYTLAYEPRAVVHVQAPSSPAALFRQRRRWAQGAVEVMRIHGGILKTVNLALIPLAFQFLATVLWMGLVLWSLGEAVFSALLRSPQGSYEWPAELGMILAITLCLFTCQSLAACTFDSSYVRRSLRLVPLAALYPIYYWLMIAPSFLAGMWRGLRSREGVIWNRTERIASPNASQAPAPAAPLAPALVN